MKEPLILVVGMNLTLKEITNVEIVNKIEEATAKCLSPYLKHEHGADKDELLFSFPHDPSVESPEIPVVFRVSFLPGKEGSTGRLHLFAMKEVFTANLRWALKDIFPNRPNIIVISEDLRQTAFISLPANSRK
jgi:hypothetical protein